MSWWQSLGLPGAQIDKSAIKFPFEVELVPELLKANIMLANFSMGSEDLVCWTYTTNGLKQAGQKELLISIKKLQGQSLSDLPQAPLEFFKTVLSHCMAKEFIEIGSISDFGENGFLTSKFPAAAYVRSQTMGDWFPPEQSLATILMTGEELEASQIGGLTRVLALLGKDSLHYPCPVWNDLSRVSVVSAQMLSAMKESFIAQMPRILVRDSGISSADKVIDLQLPLSARHFFKQLEDLQADSPLLLLCDLDERADAVLVFQEDKTQAPLAISAPGTTGTRIAGSFICFAPGQDKDNGMIIEDGYALSLKDTSWMELKSSLLAGSPFYLSRSDDGFDFRLSWHNDENQAPGPDTIQISGIEPGCSKDLDEAAKDNTGAEEMVPAFATSIDLLTHEAEIKELIELNVLKRYIEHIEDVVRDHFLCMGQTDGFNLTLNCSILPDCKAEFVASSNPIMEAEDEKDLLDRLSITYAPEISKNRIKIKLEFCVWGGS